MADKPRQPDAASRTERTLERVYLEQAEPLREFFVSRTMDIEASAELVSETFAAAYAQRERLANRAYEEVKEWVRKQARSELARFYRRGHVEQREIRYGLAPPELVRPAEDSINEVVELDDLKTRLAEGITGLPEREKLVLALHVYENLSFDEIASVLGVNDSAARRHYAEALRALAGLLSLERHAGERQPTVWGPDGLPLDPQAPERREFEVRIAAVSEELIAHLASNPHLLYDLSPRRFEELVAELYERRGFEVTLTPETGDDGVDVYVVRHDELGRSLTVVQCKRYAAHRKIGTALVRELQGTIHAQGASAGVLLTTSFFTLGARKIEQDFRYQLSLQDYFALQQLLQMPPAR